MQTFTDQEIDKLQSSLPLIRKAGGWSAEEFGSLFGVTKQTISNLENKKTKMSKTQYIAIRAVLDYELLDRSDDKAFTSVVNLCLNSEDLSEEDMKKAQAYIEGAAKTKLDSAATLAGLAALIGMAAAQTLLLPIAISTSAGLTTTWLEKIIKGKQNL